MKSYVPSKDPHYVPWGSYSLIEQVIASNQFFPVYISGLSGTGKTVMVEQACAARDRQYVRVQITPETDEAELIGSFGLVDGNTVFRKGPVIVAAESGAILLIDELDRGSNKIMCLQGLMEGKPILIKRTGELITPAQGFNIIATANTKGRGSDDGRYAAATIIDDAFLERFAIAVDQPFAPEEIEIKIVSEAMRKHDGAIDSAFAKYLVSWAEITRKTFEDGAVDNFVSTRRLCQIVQTASIFRDKMRAITLSVSRFDAETASAFIDVYTKLDPSSKK